MTLRIRSIGATDAGLKRMHNEDNFAADEENGLYVVADGMGGHAAGEVASSAAIDTMLRFIRGFRRGGETEWPLGRVEELNDHENAMVTAARMANIAVCDLAMNNDAYVGMGTTIAGLLAYDSHVAVVHVGDSRIYRLRDGKLKQVTLDHSWVNEQLQRHIITEEEAKNHRWRNVITRALGNRREIEVELKPLDIQVGDTWLLCTDGLSGMVADEDIEAILNENNLEAACEALIGQAIANGGIDNVTAVVLRVEDAD